MTGPRSFLLAAVLALPSAPSLADAERGWRPGADPFGNPETQRVAHYVSPGLLTKDKVTINFGISGHFPISLYDMMGNPGEVFAAFDQLYFGYPEEYASFVETCYAILGGFALDEEIDFCLIEQVYADATFGVSMLVDVSDMLYSDPAVGIASLGIKNRTDGRYVPLLKTETGMACSGPEEASLCVSCFYDFRALAAQEAGAVCGDPDMQHSLMALDARLPYFALIAQMADNQAEFGPWELAVRLTAQSGTTHDLTYASDDLLGALFGPR